MLEKYYDEQPIATTILKNMITKNSVSHAYLFISNNYPKTMDLVLDFAKLLITKDIDNIEKKQQIISMIDNNIYLDLKIIEPDGLWIKKDQMLDLQKKFSIKTNVNYKKIYIIKNAERLNNYSANTILKFLEEPEKNIIAILVSESPKQLLETIVSRCIQINLINHSPQFHNTLTTVEIIEKIFFNNKNNIDKLELISAKEMLDETIKFVSYYEQNGQEALLYSNKFYQEKIKNREFLLLFFDIIIAIYKDSINYLLKKEIEIFFDYKETIEKISKLNTIKTIIKKINIIIEYKGYIKYNVNTNLLMDKFILSIGDVIND